MADTPGFTKRHKAAIIRDNRNYLKLEMPRNTERMVQSSTDLLRCWRGNCDVQILLYDSDPADPDPADIARVTDYIVSYACKGNITHQAEKDIIRDTIMK